MSAADGLATLGPELVRARALLDARFVAWAAERDARAMSYPPLLRTADLARLDYFENFPHLVLVAAPLRADQLAAGPIAAAVPAARLVDGAFVLPPAACYSVYLDLRGARLERTQHVTTVATCFRNEASYDGLTRLRAFTMREIVCVGALDDTRAHLAAFEERIRAFAARLDLGLEVQVATDPFYERQEARRQMQLLAPVKHEFVYRGTVAVASLNVHRNFFGERCGITGVDGAPAFSSCVAFGLERWLHALLDRLGDPARVVAALEAA